MEQGRLEVLGVVVSEFSAVGPLVAVERLQVRVSPETSPFFIMSPFSKAFHQLSRLWGSIAQYSRKVKIVSDRNTPSSPGPEPLPSPQKILEEPQYAADFFYADDQAHSFPSSFSFSDPSSSFGLPYLQFTSPRYGLTSVTVPVETEENPSTVSYEEILVTGQNRIAAYEEWCLVTNVSMI